MVELNQMLPFGDVKYKINYQAVILDRNRTALQYRH